MTMYFFQINGRSVTTDVPEVEALLGSCFEPSPSLPALAILAGDEASVPIGTTIYRYPSQAGMAGDEIGLSLPQEGREGAPRVVGGRVSAITATQIRLWLFRRGISIDEIIASIGGEAAILWEYAPYIERDNPLVSAVAETLGLSPDEVDEAFAEASML